MSSSDDTWLAPDNSGISTRWLSDPARSSLRGKRLRRAFGASPPALDAWPAVWRELLAHWVRRAVTGKHYRCDALLARAGAQRANTALQLFERLLADGLAEVEERRDAQRGWQSYSLAFVDAAALRSALAVPEPDADQRNWAQHRETMLALPELDAARATLDQLPPRAAIERLQLLTALQRWHDEGRHRGQATRRDLAYFARQDTKKITDAEWRWLVDSIDLARFGIAVHAPMLLVSASATLVGSGGTLALGALPGFVGLPPCAIKAIERIENPPRLWRAVENRSAFEKLAARRAPDEAVLWLPGYPPGWWRDVVTHLLALAPAPLAIACDPDPDGIAIALQAAQVWQAAGQSWHPWHMSADDLAALAHRRPLSERDRMLLASLVTRSLPADLLALATAMAESGEKGEQESLFW